MILACKKSLGQITKEVGFGKTPPLFFQNSRIFGFFYRRPLLGPTCQVHLVKFYIGFPCLSTFMVLLVSMEWKWWVKVAAIGLHISRERTTTCTDTHVFPGRAHVGVVSSHRFCNHDPFSKTTQFSTTSCVTSGYYPPQSCDDVERNLLEQGGIWPVAVSIYLLQLLTIWKKWDASKNLGAKNLVWYKIVKLKNKKILGTK